MLDLERGSYLKKWKGKTPVALLYPNRYEVGMSSLGFQQVYALLNERDDLVCERVFLEDQVPLSLESGRCLTDFPFIFFSLSFEHDYTHVIELLLRGGIPPYAAERKEQKAVPLVVCGGVAVSINPEPLAPFIDLFVVGEAEEVLSHLLDLLLAFPVDSHDKMLEAAASRLRGIYVPEFYSPQYDASGHCCAIEADERVPNPVQRVMLADLQVAGHSEVLTPQAEFSNLYLTELGRGCSRGCRFCAAGFVYRPPRLWSADAVVAGLKERWDDVKRVGLLGMEMASDDVLAQISSYLQESGCALSFSSLRADRIHESLLALLSQSSLKSVAIAPDGASERLRRVINKGLDEKDLLMAASRLVEAGIFKIKLYLMIGLPTEELCDLDEFLALVRKIKECIDPIGKERGHLSEIFISVNCFVPKPWTPFQFSAFGISEMLQNGEICSLETAIKNMKKRIAYLRKGVQGFDNVHFQADKPENAAFQAILARGDRRLAPLLLDMAKHNIPWKHGLKKYGIEAERYVTTGYNEDTFFPWYVIDHGIDHGYFWQEFQKALQARLTMPCDTAHCRRCGVCKG